MNWAAGSVFVYYYFYDLILVETVFISRIPYNRCFERTKLLYLADCGWLN